MQRNLTWRWMLILLVAVMCLLSISPWDRHLNWVGWPFKPGLDLAGGTTLLYQVEVPPNVNASEAIDQTIRILSDRVDPTGVIGLVWRPQGSNRIEIQMPAPASGINQDRQRYLDALKQLLQGNLTRQQLDGALSQTGQAKQQALARLAGNDADLQKALADLVSAQEALVKAQQHNQEAQVAYDKARATFNALPSTTPEAQKTELRKHAEKLLEDLDQKAQAFLDARGHVDQLKRQALSMSLDAAELERIFNLPVQGFEIKGKGASATRKPTAPRQAALDQLKARYPHRAQQIQQTADAYAVYEKVKGSLDDPNDLIAMLRGAGILEFRIAPAPGELPDVDQYRDQLRTRGPRAGSDKPYRWFVIDNLEDFFDAQTARRDLAQHADEAPELYEQRIAQVLASRKGLVGLPYGGEIYVLLSNSGSSALTTDQPGWKLQSVGRSYDELHRPAVAFKLNTTGAAYFGSLTGSNTGKPMAIVLDGRVVSAPTINSRITSDGIITGGQRGFDEKQMDYLLRTLGAGSLQARLSENPISIQQTGASFGQDNLQSGKRAAIWALALVCVFMLGYYFFWGVVADFAMITNLLIVMGVMAMMGATFTLPGIAGLILTIGMAVDANVLIYERIREELERKADLHTAVRLGFDRAFITIFDSNITTIITCWILADMPPLNAFQIPSDIKGFGTTLGIGVAANLFTGVFCTRTLIELYLRWVKPKRLPMLATVSPFVRRLLTPNFDWLGHKWWFVGVSVVLIGAGLWAVVVRGADFLDIEFRGGTMVSFKLAPGKTMTLQDVRERMTQQSKAMTQELTTRKAQLETRLVAAGPADRVAIQRELDQTLHELSLVPELSGQRINPVTVGETQGSTASAFSIATLHENPKIVSEAVKNAFKDVLVTTLPVRFADMGDLDESAPSIATLSNRRVKRVASANLGAVLDRPGLSLDVTEYRGGAAILLEDMKPAVTVSDLTQRIERMRRQPSYEKLGFRQFTVIGLDAVRGQAAVANSHEEPVYQSAVVLVRDNTTNYAESEEGFRDPKGLAATEWSLVRDALVRDTSLGSISNFSSQVSATMQQKAIVAIIVSWLAMMVYIWFRFGDLRYGLGAIIALIHDVLMAVGLAALAAFLVESPLGQWLQLSPFRINLSMIAAVLTLIGYSVNDTIVIFDRIRENRGRLAHATPAIINDSINQTISRSILTVGTVFISVLLLYFVGGSGVHDFAFIMLVGSIAGSYSTIAIANPILLIGVRFAKQTPGNPGTPGTPGISTSVPATTK